jgi:hypothetical protein
MTLRPSILTVVAAMVPMFLATGLQAQTKTTGKVTEAAGAAQVTTEQLTGEVVIVEGNALLVRMQPNGLYRVFDVMPGRQFMIDGQTKLIGDLKPGMVLTATVTTTTQPITLRTTTVTNGTVWYVSGNYVILKLQNGETRGYSVPAEYRFIVDGKPASASQLRKGMKVSGERVVEEPRTEITQKTVVTGKSPK